MASVPTHLPYTSKDEVISIDQETTSVTSSDNVNENMIRHHINKISALKRTSIYSFLTTPGREALNNIRQAKLNPNSNTNNPVSYKFDVTNNSIAEKYILTHFWNFITFKFFPEWLAPNLITFSGFICILLVFLLININTFYLKPLIELSSSQGYSSVYNMNLILVSLLIFFYNTLDGCDGKQARRTGSSSPLGELFDHGVDALSLTVLTLCMLMVLGEIPPNLLIGMILVHIIMMLAFYTAHWEHFHTNTFYMGHICASDGQFAVIGVYLITFIYNVFIQDSKISSIVALWQSNQLFGLFSFGALVLIITMFGTVISPITSVFHVISFYRNVSQNIEKDLRQSQELDETNISILEEEEEQQQSNRPQRDFTKYSNLRFKKDVTNASVDLLILFIFFALYLTMCVLSGLTVIDKTKGTTFLEENYVILMVIGGLTFGVFLTTMNIARVTSQPFPRFTKQYVLTLTPIAIFILNNFTRVLSVNTNAFINEKVLLLLILVWDICFYLLFAVSTVSEFCECLGIKAFKLVHHSSNSNTTSSVSQVVVHDTSLRVDSDSSEDEGPISSSNGKHNSTNLVENI
ncbi:hypothetical protein ABK040_002398 [Willaertia magna]